MLPLKSYEAIVFRNLSISITGELKSAKSGYLYLSLHASLRLRITSDHESRNPTPRSPVLPFCLGQDYRTSSRKDLLVTSIL